MCHSHAELCQQQLDGDFEKVIQVLEAISTKLTMTICCGELNVKENNKLGLSCAKLREGGASKFRLSSIYLEVEVIFHLP